MMFQKNNNNEKKKSNNVNEKGFDIHCIGAQVNLPFMVRCVCKVTT